MCPITPTPKRCGWRACTARTAPGRVENAFNAKEGFYAKVDLGKKTALVRSKREVPDEELKQVVRGLGYSPVAVEPA